MSHISNRRGTSDKIHALYLERLKYSQYLDPYDNSVDILGCDYKGIKNLTYDISLNAVVFNYTNTQQGFHNVTVFCDVPTAQELDSKLDIIDEFKDIDMSEYFAEEFNICWDYKNPTVLKLINFNV